MRRISSVLGVLAILLTVMLAVPATAHAHAVAVETTPANWQVLAAPPTEISIRFSEGVDLGLTTIRLIDPAGKDMAVGRPTHPASAATTVAVSIPAMTIAGTYTVSWRSVSADTHPVRGGFTFSVGAPTSTGAPGQLAGPGGSAVVAVVYAILRWAAFVGFALLAATTFFVAYCWPAGQSRRDVAKLAWSGWITLVVTTLLTLVVYGAYATPQSLLSALRPREMLGTVDTRMGFALVARLAVLALIAIAALIWSRRGDVPLTQPIEGGDLFRRAGVVLGATVVLAYTWAFAAHSATGAFPVVTQLSDALHVSAMGVWLGGLVVIGALHLRSADPAAMRIALPRFSTTALGCVIVLVLTGTVQAWREIGSIPALFDTQYGHVLLVKLAVVVGLLGLGAIAREWVRKHYGFAVQSNADKRRARRGPDSTEIQRFRRGLALEGAMAVVLLGITAYLVNATPATAEIAARKPITASAANGPEDLAVPFDTGSGTDSGRGMIELVVAPAAVGANEVHLSVLSTAGLPRDVADLHASFSLPDKSLGPLPVQLVNGGAPGHFIATAAPLPMAGHWILTLVVRTSEVDETTLHVPVTVSLQPSRP